MHTTVKCDGCGWEIVVKTGMPPAGGATLIVSACSLTLLLTQMLPGIAEGAGPVAALVCLALLVYPLLLFGGLAMYLGKVACREAEERANAASDPSDRSD